MRKKSLMKVIAILKMKILIPTRIFSPQAITQKLFLLGLLSWLGRDIADDRSPG